MRILLLLIISFIVRQTTAQTDTSISKKKAIKDSFSQSAAVFYPPIASHVISFSQSTIKSIEKGSSKTYLYWDPHLQMLIKKPYTSPYKEPRLLNPAQNILSFIIPNNVGKP